MPTHSHISHPLTMEGILEWFLQLEERHNLMALEIEGEKVWQALRSRICLDLTQRAVFKETSTRSSSGKLRKMFVKRIVQNLARNTRRHPIFTAKRADVLVINHPRRVMVDGVYDCMYTDELLAQADFSYRVFELPFQGRHLSPVRTKNLIYNDLAFLVGKVKAVWHVRRRTLSSEIRALLQDVDREVIEEIGEPLAVGGIEAYLHRWAWVLRSLRPMVGRLFDRVQPKMLLELVNYSPEVQLFNQVAHERGIEVVELQHGSIGAHHVGYRMHPNAVNQGTPDYLLLYGEYWKRNIQWPIPEENLVTTGFPYLESLEERYRAEDSEERKEILIISQHSVGMPLAKLAFELDQLLGEKGFRVVLKLHPLESGNWKETYPFLVESGVHVVDHSKQPIYYYFGKACCQVGVYSSALYEGMYFQLSTFVLKVEGWDGLLPLIESGSVKAVDSASQIAQEIDWRPPSQAYSMLWQSNSLRKMNQFIQSRISRS